MISRSLSLLVGPKNSQGIKMSSKKGYGSTFSFILENKKYEVFENGEEDHSSNEVSDEENMNLI